MTVRRLAVLATLAGALAGCGGSGFDYVANRHEGVFFKVPDDWRVFETDDLLEPDMARGRWMRGFDAASVPDPQRVFADSSTTPRGFAEVRPLTEAERQQVSLTSLRAYGFGTNDDGTPRDPIAIADAQPEKLKILGYDEPVVDGAHGVHLRFSATAEDGARIVVDQTVLVDDRTEKRYVFRVGCTEACWKANDDELQEVIDSWTLQDR